ncbi:Putative G-protein coupled receptor 158 [Gryllus bimaculatus]|nr:Putative G-protein coupled receptor 158 [Gryllus bimaculatus]
MDDEKCGKWKEGPYRSPQFKECFARRFQTEVFLAWAGSQASFLGEFVNARVLKLHVVLFMQQKKGSREKALHHRNQRCSVRHSHGERGGAGPARAAATRSAMSRTPEDSVCSNEGPSAIYNDGPSTYSDVGTPNVSFRVSPRQ